MSGVPHGHGGPECLFVDDWWRSSFEYEIVAITFVDGVDAFVVVDASDVLDHGRDAAFLVLFQGEFAVGCGANDHGAIMIEFGLVQSDECDQILQFTRVDFKNW